MQGVLNQARAYLWIPVAQDAFRRISLRVYDHIMDLDLNFHLHKKTGEVTKMVSYCRCPFWLVRIDIQAESCAFLALSTAMRHAHGLELGLLSCDTPMDKS
jgi:hypothetical protein